MSTTANSLPHRRGASTNTAKPAATKRRTSKTDDANNWDQRLGFLMHDVSRLRRTVFDDLMRPLGVTRSQWWVLAHLSRHDGMIQSDLAGILEIGKASLGGLIDRLEASELIVRRPDETDRRVKRVYTSPKGYQLIKEMVSLNHEMSERMLAGLSADERHRLAKMLTQVKVNLSAMKTTAEADDVADED